jgi:hypothetical protein
VVPKAALKTANKENKQSKTQSISSRLASTSTIQRPLSSPGAFVASAPHFLSDSKFESSAGASRSQFLLKLRGPTPLAGGTFKARRGSQQVSCLFLSIYHFCSEYAAES